MSVTLRTKLDNMQLIIDNPELPWDWWILSFKLSNLYYVIDNPDLSWNWRVLSSNPNIDMQVIVDNPNLPWDWIGLSSNPNLCSHYIIDYPHLPWDEKELANNPFHGNIILQIQAWVRRILMRRLCRHQCRLIMIYKNKFTTGKRNLIIKFVLQYHL
uniref:Uncharacterized protein n=1 Tax=Megaviridae environmental sample TaxID=1737588 RepID=A0A5J6VID9_9VIRU|nr:MAG: hypothetical protein [Megaviridae environmental sample]